MNKKIELLYFASNAIKSYCSRNPVRWYDRELANGPGNKLTPTPAIGVFFEKLTGEGRLFNQKEYIEYAWELPEWTEWKKELNSDVIAGVEARLCRNFYPSAIDSLHVWSMLVETGKFWYCCLDIIQDAVGKSDLSVITHDRKKFKIALAIGSDYNNKWVKYKRAKRGQCAEAIDVVLDMSRKRSPGNKRWYEPEDLKPILDACGIVEQKQMDIFT
jgi:hypothetical protein